MGRGRVCRMTSDNAIFSSWVATFDRVFLNHFLKKIGSFCAHLKGNFLNFSFVFNPLLVPFMAH